MMILVIERTINDITSDNDKDEKMMSIIVSEFDRNTINSLNSTLDQNMFRESKLEDEKKQNLVEKEINTTTNTENLNEDYSKYVYIKIFFVLFAQYIIIFLTSFLGFYFGFNLKLLNLSVHISLSVIQGVILIFFIIIFILKIFFEKNIDYDDNTCYTIIFHICFPFFVTIMLFYNH